jgi:FkbM family methyltransferase
LDKMQTKLIGFVYAHRSRLKRLIFIRRPILVTLPDFKMYVRLDDWAAGARIAVKRTYERHVTSAMRPLLRPGMVMIDVGANIGYYSLLGAARVGPAGTVIAFEPGEANTALLQMSAQANAFKNIAIHALAVADVNRTVGFSMDDSNGSIYPQDARLGHLQVRAVRLDDFLKDEPRIDLVKMDIEGAEGLALAGMRQLLLRHRPILFTEFNPNALQATSGISAEAYLNSLRELGYALHVVHRVQGQNPTSQTNAEIMQAYTQYGSDHLDLAAYPQQPKD